MTGIRIVWTFMKKCDYTIQEVMNDHYETAFFYTKNLLVIYMLIGIMVFVYTDLITCLNNRSLFYLHESVFYWNGGMSNSLQYI